MPDPVRLVVICGPYQSGKMPLARKLMADDPELVLVHRDTIRDSLVTRIDEWEITQIMGDVARRLLRHKHSVIVCAWNLELTDKALWLDVAAGAGVDMEWLDVREPEIATMIPPLDSASVREAA